MASLRPSHFISARDPVVTDLDRDRAGAAGNLLEVESLWFQRFFPRTRESVSGLMNWVIKA